VAAPVHSVQTMKAEDKTPSEGTSGDRLLLQQVAPSRPIPGLEDDVRQGLLQGPPRSLPPKYFYDTRGSALFDRICDTPEYYPTRTEDALLARCAAAIIAEVRPRHIVELGSGTSRKTRRLFDACVSEECHSGYAPFDVCHDVLVEAGGLLVNDYEWLTVNALVGDYHAGFEHLPHFAGRSLFVFLGGTIGNFYQDDAVAFLSELRAHMQPGDRLLLGADRVKDPAVLHAAYNDAGGVTAAFNLNVLRVLNRELDGDFDTDGFYHHACYHPGTQRIEMYLVSKRRQGVRLSRLNQRLEFADGEEMLTEISRKFTREGLLDLLAAGGFRMETHFEAPEGYFSLVLAKPAEA